MKSKEQKTTEKISREQRLARMRAYYRKNKEKWQTYKTAGEARLTKADREKRRIKAKEYSRRNYLANRGEVICRTRQYHLADRDKWKAYQAEWYQQNKTAVAGRRKRHYHKVVKPRKRAAKAKAAFLSIRRAVEILGGNLPAFRRWVYEGRIAAVKTPGGRYLLAREYVEHLRLTSDDLPKEYKKALGLNRRGGDK